ncbi:MAG: PH domain-containing protein [Micrococcaceae bacterium]
MVDNTEKIESLKGPKYIVDYNSGLKQLTKILFEDETVVDALRVKDQNDTNGALVLTDRRIIFSSGVLLKKNSEDIALHNITSVEYNAGMAQGKITVKASGVDSEFAALNKKKANEFVNNSREAIAQSRSGGVAKPTNADELVKYANLYKEGLITEDEFNKKKQELL